MSIIDDKIRESREYEARFYRNGASSFDFVQAAARFRDAFEEAMVIVRGDCYCCYETPSRCGNCEAIEKIECILEGKAGGG